MARFIIEGEWAGYSSSQDHVVHRVVTTSKALAEWVAKNYAITFTDGTSLILSCRGAFPREKVKEIHGYDALIRDCQFYNVNSVVALTEARKAKQVSA